MYFGTMMFFTTPFNIITEGPTTTDRLELNTIMFYSFILMNLFNQFNCRLLDTEETVNDPKKNLNVFNTSLF